MIRLQELETGGNRKMTDEEYQERLQIIAGDEPDLSKPFFFHPFGVDDYAV